MHARVTATPIQHGRTAEAARVYHDLIEPEVKKQVGWRGSLYLVNAETDRAISITLWETEAAMTATESGGFYRAQVAKIEHLFAGTPVREHYEVALHALPEGPP